MIKKKIIYTDRSDTLLDLYLKDIAKYKILSENETNNLIAKYRAGDKNAMDTICKSNLRFVVTIAKRFQNRGIPLPDLISEGNYGLIKAIEKFDPERGTTFLSYAVWWIQQSIYSAIYWDSKEIRLPISQQLLVINILDATNKFIQSKHREPTSKELAQLTNISEDQIDYLAQFANKLVSVDDFIKNDADNNQICDIIPDESISIDDKVNNSYINNELEEMIDVLPVREHDIIKMFFGIGVDQIPIKQIADMFGVTKERVRQMKEGGIAKLKKKFKDKLQGLL